MRKALQAFEDTRYFQPFLGPEITHDLLRKNYSYSGNTVSQLGWIPLFLRYQNTEKKKTNEKTAQEGGDLKEILMLIEPLRLLVLLVLQVPILGRG